MLYFLGSGNSIFLLGSADLLWGSRGQRYGTEGGYKIRRLGALCIQKRLNKEVKNMEKEKML